MNTKIASICELATTLMFQAQLHDVNTFTKCNEVRIFNPDVYSYATLFWLQKQELEKQRMIEPQKQLF